ncbi:response regulator transcription factor [Catenuloplanes japonicus]|uniref:response regulator transcription factor n=1 Tax=Catenuloplanes japonicus TaxID=33876 RepID=UPI000525BA97|nr:response regulator transcription factor [Catenuloplanes japonicus]
MLKVERSGHLLAAVPEPGLRRSLVESLSRSGYRVDAVGSGAAAMELLAGDHFDLIIVDVEIPDVYDLACHRPVLADRPPVLAVTTCEGLDQVVPEVGAAVGDYVTKPCQTAELLARIQVLLRPRSGLRYADLRLDEAACQAWRGDRDLRLTPAEYRLLKHLMLHAGRVLSKTQLAYHLWDTTRDDNTIERLVSRLRHKVDRAAPPLIHTRRGFGYWLGAAAA